MDDMLGLLFFPRMNWMACKQHFLSSLKGPYMEGKRLRVCAMETVSHSLMQCCEQCFGSGFNQVS